jgi:hypothetical protein
MRRTLWILLLLLLLWWLFTVLVHDGRINAKNGRADQQTASGTFPIDGHLTRFLTPGLNVPLDLEFTNPSGASMSVSDLSVEVRTVSAPNADDLHPCSVDDFSVDQVASTLLITVAAGATSTLTSLDVARAQWPHVGMLNRRVNQNGCMGASLTLVYAAAGAVDN